VSVKVLAIQNCAIESFGALESIMRGRGAEWHLFEAWGNPPFPRAREWDAIVTGGTPLAAYHADRHPFLRAELAFLATALDASIPCLGICCGGQLLASVLGAEVRPQVEQEIGVYPASRTDAGRVDPLLRDFPDTFPVFQWHGDTFAVPAGAELLVAGDRCRNQLFRHGNVVGMQFHLEVTAAEVARWADAYVDELAAFGKARDEVVAECLAYEELLHRLLTAMVDGFFGS